MRGNDVTMDAIKYLESRLPLGIRGNTLVDGDTLAIAIGEFDAAQKRADALAAANARLREALEKIADLPGQVTDLDGTAYAAGVREAAAIARRALEESNDGRPAD